MKGGKTWNLIVIDDEPDVHDVTDLALKRKQWKKKRFDIAHAFSLKEGVELLEKSPQDHFRVAVVDVVMETDTAGLELCEYIRSHCPPSVRIILRTGQPGKAPEEAVLNNYDIDFYLEKTDATPEKLYSVIRSCLRSSEDIQTLLAFGHQLQSFTRALQRVTSLEDLLVFMQEGVGFLDLKHSAASLFFYDLGEEIEPIHMGAETSATAEQVRGVLAKQHGERETTGDITMMPGAVYGLPEHAILQMFSTIMEREDGTREVVGRGGLYTEIAPDYYSPKAVNDLYSDARLFIENWRIAYSTLCLQERLAKERMLREQMYFDRLQSIATMVTGVAHEMNTPLGVANTAMGMVVDLSKQLAETPEEDMRQEILEDLESSVDLFTKNLVRAQDLIQNFKQLSVSQLSDQRVESPLLEVILTCVETMSPALKKRGVTANIHGAGEELLWDGYPGHLTQVIVNFIQNTIRYAYEEGATGGSIDIELGQVGENVKVVYKDHGKGIAPEILPRIWEPFVTSGRNKGGTGLGLAISHNIITSLLGGSVEVTSAPGDGATFTLLLPAHSPDPDDRAQPTGFALR